MGVGVSGWPLARAVSKLGQLGVVSGTALDIVLARRLQLGDPEGHCRRAMERFPIPGVVERVMARHFIPGGKPAGKPFRATPKPSIESTADATELTVLGNFVEVYLAKEGHRNPVGINFLEKIQVPTLPAVFGAMLAGIDFIFMGAGIPRAIPLILDHLAEGKAVELRLSAENAATGQEFFAHFDPAAFFGGAAPKLNRPNFVPIISCASLAITMHRKSGSTVQGFVVEGPTAGGHNAPPRGVVQLNERGEPIYGVRDVPDLDKIAAIGLPFWLAGGYAEPERLQEALSRGAAGVQIGTAFAFCEESGMDPALKRRVLDLSRAGKLTVKTDPLASPTGFPFKVVQLEGTMSDPKVIGRLKRLCDKGFLRHPYVREDGTLGYRCPAEPVKAFVSKGGTVEETVGRLCVCNGLLSTIGLSQAPADAEAIPLVTAGDDVVHVARFLKPGEDTYTAADVIAYVLG